VYASVALLRTEYPVGVDAAPVASHPTPNIATTRFPLVGALPRVSVPLTELPPSPSAPLSTDACANGVPVLYPVTSKTVRWINAVSGTSNGSTVTVMEDGEPPTSAYHATVFVA